MEKIIVTLVSGVIIGIIVRSIICMIVYFYSLIRRLILSQRNDYVCGDWIVYRFFLRDETGIYVIHSDKWSIKRNKINKYVINVCQIKNEAYYVNKKITCTIIKLEKQAFNVLWEGDDHYQQSLISFRPVGIFPTKMIGLGVGIDSRGDTCARIYFARKAENNDLDDEDKENEAKNIVIESTK